MPRKTVEKKTYVCCQCHNTFESLTDFYKTYSTLYTDTGHLPICKNCFLNLFNSYVSKYQDRCKAMQRVCMAFDLYYVDSLFTFQNSSSPHWYTRTRWAGVLASARSSTSQSLCHRRPSTEPTLNDVRTPFTFWLPYRKKGTAYITA